MTDTYTGPSEFLTITDDKDPVTVERHKRRYERAVGLVGRTGGRWLDCACGSGYGSRIIAAAEPSEYWGIDRSTDAIAQARHNLGTLKGCCFWDLDIKDAAHWMAYLRPFDVILSLETLEHLEPDVQESWVKAAAFGLDRGGVLILACPIGNDGPSSYNRYHLHEPSLDGLNALLSRHFTTVAIETEAYVDTGGRDAVQAFAVCQ